MHQRTLEATAPARGLHDITAAVADVVRSSGVVTGLCHLFVQHTSASLLIQENASPDVLSDLERFFAKLAPDGDPAYDHDEEGPDDMSAHIRSALTATFLTIPVMDGKLALGVWQAVYLYEHRTTPRIRRIVVTVSG